MSEQEFVDALEGMSDKEVKDRFYELMVESLIIEGVEVVDNVPTREVSDDNK